MYSINKYKLFRHTFSTILWAGGNFSTILLLFALLYVTPKTCGQYCIIIRHPQLLLLLISVLSQQLGYIMYTAILQQNLGLGGDSITPQSDKGLVPTQFLPFFPTPMTTSFSGAFVFVGWGGDPTLLLTSILSFRIHLKDSAKALETGHEELVWKWAGEIQAKRITHVYRYFLHSCGKIRGEDSKTHEQEQLRYLQRIYRTSEICGWFQWLNAHRKGIGQPWGGGAWGDKRVFRVAL